MPDKKYSVIVSPRVYKDLRKVDPKIAKKIIKAIEEDIQVDPYCGEKLVSLKVGQWKYRIGDYRIRYDIEGDEIYIYRVIGRDKVYKKR